MAIPRTNLGRHLKQVWNIPAQHVLYHHEGTWFHTLECFPGALCDPDGYVVFETEDEFLQCRALRIGKHVRAPDGLKGILGYTQVLALQATTEHSI